MTTEPQSLTSLERRIGRVFTAGVSVSAASLLCGLILYLLVPDAAATSWFLGLGLMVLMATPLLRVVVSLAEYVRIRDWIFVLTTIAVLVELTVTIVYALRQR